MEETPKPNLLRHLLLLFLLLSLPPTPTLSATSPSDTTAMLALAASLTPTPTGWSGPDPCSPKWPGVSCSSSRIISINLASSSLSGSLPPSTLPQLTALQSLSLQNNQISGPLPPLPNLSSLKSLFLDSNNFSSIPSSFFTGLVSLQTLALDNNPFSPWSLPNSLLSSTNLITFSARNANIINTIPDFFSTFANLQSLRLSYNNLTGNLPSSLALTSITNLWLNRNNLSGSIELLGSMTQLAQVWLHSNSFTGSIPDLSKCTQLFDLQLRDNLLTGVLPDSVMALSTLVNVSLANNKLQGPYPTFRSGVRVDLGTTNSFCSNAPGPCDPTVTVLLAIAAAVGYPMSLASPWKGDDPCGDHWSYVSCDLQGTSVIGLNLGNLHLSGTISPNISNLTALRILILSNNSLGGLIPDSLVGLSQLNLIDVSNNNLTGSIPHFASNVTVRTSGNPFLRSNLTPPDGSGGSTNASTNGTDSSTPTASPSGRPKSSLIGLIAVIVTLFVIFVFVVSFLCYKCFFKKHKKVRKNLSKLNDPETSKSSGKSTKKNGSIVSKLVSQSSSGDHPIPMAEVGNMVIPVHVLRKVTNDFSESNILGKGGFGVVYKGVLNDGTQIAVKRMESTVMGSKGMAEFLAEIAVLTKVRHRHLVALLGYCIDGDERLLVYECMPKGTLGEHLFDWNESDCAPLSWKHRLIIALDVARGVEYLHSLAHKSFIHRDLKPSNILLGDDMRAKVADFGLVKLAPEGKYSVETRLAGTFGYLAPEYAVTGRVTTKVDVYAFGVVLMELLTGRKALDESLPDESCHLVTWFRRILINKDNMSKALDPILDQDEETVQSISTVAELAGHCTAREPLQRPDMGHAVNILSPLVEQWKPASREENEEVGLGIDFSVNLPQALQKWQSNEGPSMVGDTKNSSSIQSSIPEKPAGFADSFDSTDCR